MNYGMLLAFMGVDVAFSSSGLAYEGLKPVAAHTAVRFRLRSVLLLWLNLGPTARWAGTPWAVLGIACGWFPESKCPQISSSQVLHS